MQKFAIDGHTLTVIAMDFTPVRPYNTSVLTLGVGQRADVLVRGHEDPTGKFWMRSQLPGGTFCGGNDNTQSIRATVLYESAGTATEPSSLSVDNDASCIDAPLDITEPEHPVAVKPDPLQLDFVLTLDINATGSFVWMINNASFTADLSQPLLFNENLSKLDHTTLYSTGDAKSVRLNVTNATPFQHPFHLHGYQFQVLASGPNAATSTFPATDADPLAPPPATTWDGSIEGSTLNPLRRDVHIVPALGYAVFQFDTDNPGVWPFHCHTAWHQSGGMSVNLLVRPQEILEPPPGKKESSCDAWANWSKTSPFVQIDAGA